MSTLTLPRPPAETFRAWVARRRVTDDPAGDFVDDFNHDQRLPDPRTLRELEVYLAVRCACPGAVESARAVWARYAAAMRALDRRARRKRDHAAPR